MAVPVGVLVRLGTVVLVRVRRPRGRERLRDGLREAEAETQVAMGSLLQVAVHPTPMPVGCRERGHDARLVVAPPPTKQNLSGRQSQKPNVVRLEDVEPELLDRGEFGDSSRELGAAAGSVETGFNHSEPSSKAKNKMVHERCAVSTHVS